MNNIKEIFNTLSMPKKSKETVEEAMVNIFEYIAECEKKTKEATETVENWNKDTEIQKLKAKIQELKDELRRERCDSLIFRITPEEKEKIEIWQKEHEKAKHGGSNYAGAIGGRYEYRFLPTSIGTACEIKCSCGAKYCFREIE